MVVIGQIGVEPQRLRVAGFAGCRDRVQNAGFAWPDRAVVRRPRLEHVGHRPEITRPLGVCHPWPRPTVERPTCGTDDQVHIRGLRFGNLEVQLLCRGVDDVDDGVRSRLGPFAVDEESAGIAQRHNRFSDSADVVDSFSYLLTQPRLLSTRRCLRRA
jgi:hypothetical protein